MDKIKIIEVSDENLISVVETLAYSIWRQHYTPIIGRKQVEYMLDKFQSRQAIFNQIKEGYLYYLIKDETGDWIGYIGVIPKEKELFLSKLYVNYENRGKGYGRQAIEFIEKIAREKGLSKIALTVNKNNTNSIQAYKKFGFVIACPIVQDIGNGFVMDDYRMEKFVGSLL